MSKLIVTLAEYIVDKHVAFEEEEIQKSLMNGLLNCKLSHLKPLLFHLTFLLCCWPYFFVLHAMAKEERDLRLLTICLNVFLHVVCHL